jgi:hypothetical protein
MKLASENLVKVICLRIQSQLNRIGNIWGIGVLPTLLLLCRYNYICSKYVTQNIPAKPITTTMNR